MKQRKPERRSADLKATFAALRTAGELLLAPGPIAGRLHLAAIQIGRIAGNDAQLKGVAEEFRLAAVSIDSDTPPSRFHLTGQLLKVPVSKEFLKRLPREALADWKSLEIKLARLEDAFARLSGYLWMQRQGPTRVYVFTSLAGFNERVGFDSGILAGQAYRLADAALLDAGVAMLGLATQVEPLIGHVAMAMSLCGNDCKIPSTKDCKASDVIIVPYGTTAEDQQDFEQATAILKAAGWIIPGKYLSPGGKKMMREAIEQLKKVKKAADKIISTIGDGYSVFVVLEYKECTEGRCGNYWKTKSKLVELDPPPGKKEPGGDGWSAALINNLGDNEAQTEAQLQEFKDLAEAECP